MAVALSDRDGKDVSLQSTEQRLRTRGWIGLVALLTLLFIQPLAGLMQLALHNELHSHVLLVPFITGYLLYTQRRPPVAAYRSSIGGAVVVGGIGLAALAAGDRACAGA